MTDRPATFSASYADWKLIKTRRCVQIVLEVSLEAANEAYEALGGMPNAGTETWVAVARLDLQAIKESGASAPVRETESDHHGDRPVSRSWHELEPSQQAALLCKDASFQAFLAADISVDRHVINEEAARNEVLLRCKIGSRSQIKPGSAAAQLWRTLVSDYRAWIKEAEIVG